MTTIQQAAMKPIKDRRASDMFKIKAGHMLTYYSLAQQENPQVTESVIIRKVVRKNINRFFGCLSLPLTLGYFFFYSVAARLHEDITHVFLMESEFRQRLDASLENVETIPQLWDYFEGDFLNLFFPSVDEFGEPLQKKGIRGDKWGNWGRVLTYNQMQGLVKFEQSRNSPAKYGKSTPCCPDPTICSQRLQVLSQTDEGFASNAASVIFNPDDFGSLTCSRRLETNASVEIDNEPLDRTPEYAVAEARRLKYLHPTLRSSLPQKTSKIGDRFKFHLYPMESQTESRERLKYFRDRKWLDRDSKWVDVLVYVVNADMGRPRLCEIKIQFAFALSGGIFYYLDLQTVMLQMFPGIASMVCDFIWFLLLVVTTLVYVRRLWASFVRGEFLKNIVNLKDFWEFFVIFAGWMCVYGFYQQSKLIKDVNVKLEDLRELGWRSTQWRYLQASNALQSTVDDVTTQLVTIRYLMAQYLLFLMFRFLVGFAVQPRLATVTITLRKVLPDILHFLIVFVPTFLAYVISGSLIFGRRLEKFATIQASFSTCFRIIMECEYDWDELAAEYYWTSALWIWSFILIIVLILLNMVLAIILDIYNDVRQASLSGEPVWTTIYNYLVRARLMHFWVPDTVLEDRLLNELDKPMISRDDIKDDFPDIPDQQLDLLFRVCAADMGWEATRFLDKTTSMKMSGAVKLTTDKVNSRVTSMISEEDPLKSFVNVKPQTKAQLTKKVQQGSSLFLSTPCSLKGNRNPHLADPKLVSTTISGVGESSPEWMKVLSEKLTDQKKWMLYIAYQVENLQWQMQQSHMKKMSSSGAKKVI